MYKLLFVLVLNLYVSFITIRCSTKSQNYTVEIIDGVRNIHNLTPKFDTSPITFEFVRKWGELESEDENFMFFRPNDIAIDSRGEIYIADTGNHRIQKYDSSGKYILTIGRRGQGPGEFSYPRKINIDDDNKIYVSDFSYAVKIFDHKGIYVSQINFNLLKDVIWVRLNSGSLIRKPIGYIEQGITKKRPEYLFEIEDVENNHAKIGELKNYDLDGLQRFGKSNGYIHDKDSNYYTWYISKNLIEKYDKDFKLLYTIDRVLPYEETKNRTKEYPSTITNPNADRNAYRLVYNKFTFFAGVDHKNRLWVGTYSRPDTKEERIIFWEQKGKVDNRMFEVYDSEGVLLYRLKHDFGMKTSRLNYRIIGDKLFVIDTYNEMAIFEYRIVDN